MTKSFTTADGRTLTYRREGDGPVLVCHPGGPGFSSTYLADFGGLGESFTLVFFNPRGTGGSGRAQTYALGGYVSDLEELRVQLGLEEMNLLGHSHGGFVAIDYAFGSSTASASTTSSSSLELAPSPDEAPLPDVAASCCARWYIASETAWKAVCSASVFALIAAGSSAVSDSRTSLIAASMLSLELAST